MAGKKRTRTGELKHASPQQPPPSTITPDAIPPCARPPLPPPPQSSTPLTNPIPTPSNPSNPHQKLPKLPPNTKLTPRPLLHPSLPSPYSSSQHPKALYITASTPFIPSVKRIRALLAQVSKRQKQADAASQRGRGAKGPVEANGRLVAGDVERGIVDGVVAAGKGRGKGQSQGEGERVYLKATGRAIPRALEIGVYFQGEEDVEVRVEMGSVKAVDDIEVVGGDDGEEGEGDVPETRIRNVSSVTVSIGFK